MTPPHGNWLLSTVPFQFSETVVIFQDILHICTADCCLFTLFPLEVSGKCQLAAGRGLICVASSSRGLNLCVGTPRRSPSTFVDPIYPKQHVGAISPYGIIPLLNLGQRKQCSAASLVDSSKFHDPFHQSSSSRKRSRRCIFILVSSPTRL